MMGNLFRAKAEKDVAVFVFKSLEQIYNPVFITAEELDLKLSLLEEKTTSDSLKLKLRKKVNSSYSYLTLNGLYGPSSYIVTEVFSKTTNDGIKIELGSGTIINEIEVNQLRKKGVEISILH